MRDLAASKDDVYVINMYYITHERSSAIVGLVYIFIPDALAEATHMEYLTKSHLFYFIKIKNSKCSFIGIIW